MRPSSSADPNAPYRAAMTSLVDCNFFTDEQTEQTNSANTTRQDSPLTALSPRTASSSNAHNALATTNRLSAPEITVGSVLEYLRHQGHPCDDLMYATIINRLESANISAETLLTATKAAYDAEHPLLANLNVNAYERSELINRLGGIVTRRQGFRAELKSAIQSADNNPGQLIANLLRYIRR